MTRLNDRAFEILHTELQKYSSTEKLVKVQRDIVLKRLEKLRSLPGSSASLEELRYIIVDIIPNFSEKVLIAAAKANCPPENAFRQIKWRMGIVIGSVGMLWVVNLPYPMLRLPVARTAPILLLPSYISMDYHYRQAIAKVEQADQLINQATASADFTLGEIKVKEAQKHLDALPVWFLGYWPQYTFWFGWQFTLDEFKSARASVGRMEAKVFQEKNALEQLNQGIEALNAAKQHYQVGQTATEKETALTSWQTALDRLKQIPSQTLAGRTAQTELAASKRDYEQVALVAAGGARTSTLITAAQQFAIAATEFAQKPPHNASKWSEIAELWKQAIDQLQQVLLSDLGYVEAQKLRAQYSRNLAIVRTNLQAEQTSVAAIETAKAKIETLLASAPADSSSESRIQLISQLQGIINQLETVKSGTTAYAEAQQLMRAAQNKLKQIQPQ